MVIKSLSNDKIECVVDEGRADEVIEKHESYINDVALVPLDVVLEALKKAKKRGIIKFK